MTTTTKPFRYHLPKKAAKGDCPQCGPKHRKTLSRYIDRHTGELLPDHYGRCDRESNCGYHLSPYHKGPSGLSYAEETYERWKQEHGQTQASSKKNKTTRQAPVPLKPVPLQPNQIYSLPEQVFAKSLGRYEQNQFAQLLIHKFGESQAIELLNRFQVGTSSYWPGACVFWLIDEQQRTRAGQVVLFKDDWHKAKYTDKEGEQKVCISSVSHGLLRRYRQQQQDPPDWLVDYHQNAPRWPILFGLHQLVSAPANKPIAIVEAPKTAVVCSAFMEKFVWMAVGALSYLNAERIAPLRNRKIVLFPDLSKDGKAFERWSGFAVEMRAQGYRIIVNDLLERDATEEQRQQGLDLADFLLQKPLIVKTIEDWANNPGSICKPDESQLERLVVESCDDYPTDWDEPSPSPETPAEPYALHSAAPIAFDAAEQLRRIRHYVID